MTIKLTHQERGAQKAFRELCQAMAELTKDHSYEWSWKAADAIEAIRDIRCMVNLMNDVASSLPDELPTYAPLVPPTTDTCPELLPPGECGATAAPMGHEPGAYVP